MAEDTAINADTVESAEAVEAMTVEKEESISETEKIAEDAEVAEIVRKDEMESQQKNPKTVDVWADFEPPPDAKYDWIQLTSGEWLKGDFKVLYDYTLEFDSDELNFQEFDFDDVKRLRTRDMKSVLVQGDNGGRDTTTLRGLLEIKGDQVILRRSEYKVEISRDEIISIADGTEKETGYWSGMLSIGLNARGGNTETTDTTVMANLMRRTAASRFNAEYLANYSEAGDTETAKNHRLSGFYDRFLGANFYWKVFGSEYYRDPFSNIDGQYSFLTGMGYDVIHTSKTEWGVHFGVGYQYQEYVSVETNADNSSESGFTALGTILDHEISDNLDFVFDYTLRVLNDENGKYTHHLLTTLSFDLFKDLDLDISVIWDRIEKPQPTDDGSIPKQEDYQLIVSVAYEF
jgi:putative salt-induced outer membrane protein YdiY